MSKTLTAEEKIKFFEKAIPKLSKNKKILPLKIEALNWELRALKLELELSRYKAKVESENKSIDFGDYVKIEMKRYGVPNEMYTHKVIRALKSNTYVDVPVQSPATEKLHDKMEDVVSCIVCGIDETQVLKYRIKDVQKLL